jgi:ABC-type uncharacterized transport system involved in gliding motility auxiliary subunit
MRFLGSRRARALLALVSAFVLFVSVNIIADRTLGGLRIDLTDQHLYTLSQGTRDTLAKIDEPILLRFYYSPQLGKEIPSYGVYAQRVREMLEEYEAAAHGKVILEMLNPEPFSPTEDRAVALGLQGVPVDQGGEQVYFGLAATNSTDDEQTIPFFQPERERFLEYDITKLLHALAFPKKPVVGLMTELPLEGDIMAAMQGRPMVPYVVIEQLKQLYDVHTVSTDVDRIPDHVDVLMVVHPQHLSDKTQYAIDQFVLKGGKALVFVDPDSETQQMHPSQLNPPGMPNDSELDRLFAAWGLRMVPKMVAGDLRDARKVNAGTEEQVVAVDYVAWLALHKDALNPSDVVTGDLSQLTMATSGILEPLPNAKTTFTPLIHTSVDSEEIPVEKLKGTPDVAALLKDFQPDGKELVLAARITGPASTAFPDGPPPEKPAAKTDPSAAAAAKPDQSKPPLPPQIKQSAEPINVIAVADTDILEDRFWVQVQDFFGQRVEVPVANNGDFVINAVDSLAGGNDLIGLRSRGTSARPFTVIDNIQRAADEKYETTAKTLQDQLKATEKKISDLRNESHAGVAQSGSEEQTLENFRTQMLRTRQELRKVQLAERVDINRLEAAIEFFDIGAVPILVGIAALIVGIVRLERRKRAARTA